MTRWHIWDVVVFGDVVALVPNVADESAGVLCFELVDEPVWLTSSPWG